MARILKSRYFPNSEFLSCGIGSRPSYAWRSLMHGCDLMKQGLITSIGPGTGTSVWCDNWILDTIPRPPMYRHDGIVDLTLKVSDLMINNTRLWNEARVRELFMVEDAERILRMKNSIRNEDVVIWGFTKHGAYTSQSGYKFSETLENFHHPPNITTSPIEKQLWRAIWKTKAPAKLKHFLWKALSGALAVKERLRSRHIPVDPTCVSCGAPSESICHVLFQCPTAAETWALSGIPLPTHGFSHGSVFLTLFHMVVVNTRKRQDAEIVKPFP